MPGLRSGDVVIWDNLKPHKARAVVAAVEAGRGTCRAAAAVEPRPDADRGDVLEGQGALRSAAARIDGGDLCGDRLGLA